MRLKAPQLQLTSDYLPDFPVSWAVKSLGIQLPPSDSRVNVERAFGADITNPRSAKRRRKVVLLHTRSKGVSSA